MTIALWRRETRELQPAAWASYLLASVLVIAGAIHLALMPEHLARSTLLGLGFCAAGLAQLGLAALVLIRPWRVVFTAVIAISLVLMALYAYNVFIGLPFHEAPAAAVQAETDEGHDATHEHATHEAPAGHHESGLAIGAGEPVDAFGAGTQAAEIAAVALGVYILARARARPDRHGPNAQAG